MHAVRPFKKARATNATNTSFPSKVLTTTEPSGDGVHDIVPIEGGISPCKVLVVPYGTGDANDVFDMRIIGWRPLVREAQNVLLWVPTILASLTCTLGAGTGVAGTPVLNTALIVDTITILSEPSVTADTTRQGLVEVYSPANDTLAWAELDLRGSYKIEFTFDATTGDPTGMNALFALR